jgi:hypothetical protein
MTDDKPESKSESKIAAAVGHASSRRGYEQEIERKATEEWIRQRLAAGMSPEQALEGGAVGKVAAIRTAIAAVWDGIRKRNARLQAANDARRAAGDQRKAPMLKMYHGLAHLKTADRLKAVADKFGTYSSIVADIVKQARRRSPK